MGALSYIEREIARLVKAAAGGGLGVADTVGDFRNRYTQEHALRSVVNAVLLCRHQLATRGIGELTIYVDSVNGADHYDGLTAQTALKTLEAAHRLVPLVMLGPSSKVIIKLAGVGGFDADATAQATYDTENVLLPSGGNAEHQLLNYRGPHMVRSSNLASGPNNFEISALTSLWWQQGTHARTRTVSANPGAGYTHAGTRISRGSGANWTVNDPAMRYFRVTRGGRKVIFEAPIARNGTTYVDLDLTRIPAGALKLAAALQVGDSAELVRCGAKLTNSLGLSISIEGHGACSGPYDHNQVVTTRGGGGAWMERLERDKRFMAWGCWGLSQDRCDVTTDGDDNYFGGSGSFVNCLHTSLGLLLHGNWVQIHDTANCRPDVASNGGTADPIYQDVDAFSCWGVLRGRTKLFLGSDTSSSPAYLTLERNLSVYDAPSEAAILAMYGSRFVMFDQRNRAVQVQGTGNPLGLDVRHGSQAFITENLIHVLGDGEDGEGLSDARLGGGATKTWDEFHAGTGFGAPSQANNWMNDSYNFSRLSAYTT